MLTVDIDTGGTMTDALVSDGTARHAFKVDTTPHDYTVSLVHCLERAAAHFGCNGIASFLKRVALIRWSSTITTNVLGERRGSKVGLLIAKGHEETLYGQTWSPVVGELVAETAIIGLSPEPTSVEVLAGVKQLLEAGVRRICVCLPNAFPDNASEVAIKCIVEGQYPDHIIGSVPVLLGSEMAPLRHDQTRVHYSLINAYTHASLASSLFKAEDILRDEYDWAGALLVGHTSGGVARIGKTKAVDTIESGPVFGTFAGAYMAGLYGLRDVVCFDVGGTTTKASVVRDGRPVFQRGGKLLEIPVHTSIAMLRSAIIGGGSVARADGQSVALGPDSMGAAPGPACYGLGGENATLTDALLLLGYLDPTSFLGGRRVLDPALSRAVIERNVARPLGISAETAASMIRDEAIERMAALVAGVIAEAKLDASRTSLFAFGGNGPMFAAFLAGRLGMQAAYAFDLGPVFGALGSAISDVVHTYERGLELAWTDQSTRTLGPTLAAMRREADRDLRGEGFEPARATFRWKLHVGAAEEDEKVVSAEVASSAPADVIAALDTAMQISKCCRQPVLGVLLESRYVVGVHETRRVCRPSQPGTAETRSARFGGQAETAVPVLRWQRIGAGDRFEGPAIVNGDTLTCPIPAGWAATVDDYSNLRLIPVG